jgi:hypothetical protein
VIHIVPLDDLKPHEEEGTQCHCSPRVFFSDPDTGEAFAEAIVVHRSFDGREGVEEAEAILNRIGDRKS